MLTKSYYKSIDNRLMIQIYQKNFQKFSLLDQKNPSKIQKLINFLIFSLIEDLVQWMAVAQKQIENKKKAVDGIKIIDI